MRSFAKAFMLCLPVALACSPATAHGLNPKVPDSNQLAPSGYTQLEEYVNQLAAPPPSSDSH